MICADAGRLREGYECPAVETGTVRDSVLSQITWRMLMPAQSILRGYTFKQTAKILYLCERSLKSWQQTSIAMGQINLWTWQMK